MKLEGSCHCRAVHFTVTSDQPWPYQRCYCSICRKTSGADCMINLGADARTLQVTGGEHVRVFRAMVERNGERVQSQHERHYCELCGCHLWAFHPKWPELVHPVAGVIDTPLPRPPAHVHMMVASKAPWVEIHAEANDEIYDAYPRQSLADWHRDHGYEDPA